MKQQDMIILFGIIIVVGIIYLQYFSSEPIYNDGILTTQEEQGDQEDDKDADLRRKFVTRDSARTNDYKYSRYRDGKRNNNSDDALDSFFNDPQIDNKTYNGFVPRDETGGNMATYVPGVKKELSELDKFNAEDLLPNEKNNDWWEDVQTTTVKNRHLINIYRPVGINTIQSSLKNPSYDIRGTPPNPKTFVSPWNQSSYEPDINIKNQSLCY